jgi:hypothetical protein
MVQAVHKVHQDLILQQVAMLLLVHMAPAAVVAAKATSTLANQQQMAAEAVLLQLELLGVKNMVVKEQYK